MKKEKKNIFSALILASAMIIAAIIVTPAIPSPDVAMAQSGCYWECDADLDCYGNPDQCDDGGGGDGACYDICNPGCEGYDPSYCSDPDPEPYDYPVPPYDYPAPPPSYEYPTPSYQSPSALYDYPTPSYNYPTPSYIYPTPPYNYPTPEEEYDYPTPSYLYPTPPPTTYTVSVSINSGSGTITGPGISCPGDCSETYNVGTWITLIATPASGYSFNNWIPSNGTICGGQGATCSALVDADKTARVNFTPVPAFDYSLSNSGNSNVAKTNGNAFTQNIITRTLSGGPSQSVTLAVFGTPSGVSYSVSSNPCNPTCSSTVTFTVPSSAPVGTYPITITGAPLGKTTNFNLVISGNPTTATCFANPPTTLVGQNVTWSGSVSGGTPPLSYSWSGTNIPTNPAPATNPYSRTYSTIGQKTATLRVTDADGLITTCAPATVQINFDPNFEEF